MNNGNWIRTYLKKTSRFFLTVFVFCGDFLLNSNLMGYAGTSQNQESYIRGKVAAESVDPLHLVSILLESTSKGTTTNAKGNFTLRVAQGNYRIQVSFVGYETKSQSITISTSDQTVNFTLSETTLSLNEIVVLSSRPLVAVDTTIPANNLPLEIDTTVRDIAFKWLFLYNRNVSQFGFNGKLCLRN